jgi:hypothetical protein
MLQKTIKFKNYEGKEVERTYYFNLMKSELMELEMSTNGGLSEMITKSVESEDAPQIIAIFKKMILLAYGERDPDGEHFNKSPEISARFANSLAYSALFMELATSSEAASAFVNGIIPKEQEAA